jgi:porphobilinogen synthase
MQTELFYRGRRLRRSAALRELMREVRLAPANLIMPYFVIDHPDAGFSRAIASMPGQSQLSLAGLRERIAGAVPHGLRAVLLFGIPAGKDETGSQAYDDNGIVQRAVRMLKRDWPEMVVITDVCLCEYTSHGHCGLIRDGDRQGMVLNDETLELLDRMALSHVRAGADMVAPSDMMDGRVLSIRRALDAAGFIDTPIMAYSAKFASALYGPFRDAAESGARFGDRRAYQMDFCSTWEAEREVEADITEGADIVMIKPAGFYLDIIGAIKRRVRAPIAAYQVSGEYAMIRAAGSNRWIDEDEVALESLIAIRRAGASLIITYFAEDFLRRGLIR